MAEKTLRVPGNAQPTFWNKDTALGAAIGYMIPYIGLIAAPIGGIIGGFMGKSRMEKEKQDGKDVSPPTFWNRFIVIGAAIGELVGSVAAVVILIATAAVVGHTALGAGANLGASADAFGQASRSMHGAFTTTMAGYLGAGAAVLGGIAIGGIIGGNIGKARMEHEYKEAEAYVTRHGEYKGKTLESALAQEKAPQQSYTVSPEEARLLESRLAAVESRMSHADRARESGLAPSGTTPS